MTRPGDPAYIDAAKTVTCGSRGEAADLVVKGMEGAVGAKTVTYDLERQLEGATLMSTSGFAEAIVDHLD